MLDARGVGSRAQVGARIGTSSEALPQTDEAWSSVDHSGRFVASLFDIALRDYAHLCGHERDAIASSGTSADLNFGATGALVVASSRCPIRCRPTARIKKSPLKPTSASGAVDGPITGSVMCQIAGAFAE